MDPTTAKAIEFLGFVFWAGLIIILAVSMIVSRVKKFRQTTKAKTTAPVSHARVSASLHPAPAGSASVHLRRAYAADDLDQLAPAGAFMQTIQRGADWITALVQAFHVLIVGGTRGGKTVLAHELAERRARAGDAVYVIDPDARPGMWPSARIVAGAGDDFEEADQLLAWFVSLIEGRRKERRDGRRTFEPITLVITELGSVMTSTGLARSTFEEIVRRGAKLGIRLIADVQDNQVKTLKLEGASALLINLTRVEVQRQMDGRRVATIDRQAYTIPQLTDPETLADAAFEERNLSRIPELPFAGTPVPVRPEIAVPPGTPPSYQQRISTVPPYEADDFLDQRIKDLHAAEVSWNKIADIVGLKGQKQQRNARIRRALGLPEPSTAELVQAGE